MADLNRILRIEAGELPIAYADRGSGRPFLLLHGGAGPASMEALAAALARNGRALLPTHPGFAGQPRPDWLHTIAGLASAYLALIEVLELQDIVLVGNSVGGWIAAEMALRDPSRIAAAVLMNSVGIDADPFGRPIVDPLALAPAERLALSYHDASRFAVASAGPQAAAAMAANQKTLRIYAGQPFMHDPGLRQRLSKIAVPAMIVWGESDRIVDIAYGRRLADAIANARFETVPEAGHFPQIEQLDRTASLIERFAAAL